MREMQHFYDLHKFLDLPSQLDDTHSFHVHTIESFCILNVQKGCGSPDPDCPVVRGARQQTGEDGVPAHTVDRAGVTTELGDGQLTAPVPDVNFVVCREMDNLSAACQRWKLFQ